MEELLHHGILAQIIIPRLDQLPVNMAVAVQALHQLGSVHTSHEFHLPVPAQLSDPACLTALWNSHVCQRIDHCL